MGETYKKELTMLETLETKLEELTEKLTRLSSINSGTYHLDGIEKMKEALAQELAPLGEVKAIPIPFENRLNSSGDFSEIPLGDALYLEIRPEAKLQVLLAGHMDTVFDKNHPFQTPQIKDHATLVGPGSSDMKGGLLIMIEALKCFEAMRSNEEIGFKILINADEEIGSVGSHSLIFELAGKCDYALVFEPAYPDGSLVSTRKGSANYTLVIKGKSAHAGRDFYSGVHAIYPLGPILEGLNALNDPKSQKISVNVASLSAPGPVNNVPDTLSCRINIRAETKEDLTTAGERLEELVKKQDREGLTLLLKRDSYRAPKEIDERTKGLMTLIEMAGEEMGLPVNWVGTGGVCDGNIISSAGCACIDTLGVVGGKMHTSEEYVHLPSLIERTKLAVIILKKLAAKKGENA